MTSSLASDIPDPSENGAAGYEALVELATFSGEATEFWRRYLLAMAGYVGASRVYLLRLDDTKREDWKCLLSLVCPSKKSLEVSPAESTILLEFGVRHRCEGDFSDHWSVSMTGLSIGDAP